MAKKGENLLQARLKEVISYNPETGEFLRIKGHKSYLGHVSKPKNSGYVVIEVDTVKYLAHRLAFLYMTGSFPKDFVDHINGERGDNRWVNLRDVTHDVNVKNKKASRRNSSGIPNIFKRPTHRKWAVRIAQKYIGYYEDLDEAIKVRDEEFARRGYHPNHGKR